MMWVQNGKTVDEYKIYCWEFSYPGMRMGDRGNYNYLKVIARSEDEAKSLVVAKDPKATIFWEGPDYGGIRRFKIVPVESSVIEMVLNVW